MNVTPSADAPAICCSRSLVDIWSSWPSCESNFESSEAGMVIDRGHHDGADEVAPAEASPCVKVRIAIFNWPSGRSIV